jgi:3-hydroxybutyryl-CoA dehydrogenase
METIVFGTEIQCAEFKAKFPQTKAQFYGKNDYLVLPQDQRSLIWDFLTFDEPGRISFYQNLQNKHISLFAHAVGSSLAEWQLKFGLFGFDIFGFNGLPGFFNRDILELSVLNPQSEARLKELMEKVGSDFQLVEDRVGMVSPRVICMIINEAYFTLQEGTANKEDIDLGMKLGTNYPKGPFEWSKEIGISNVYQTLNALWTDTRDERYKICPLLKKEYLKSLV